MEIKKVGVVGAGTMGNGIAQLAAFIGCDVVMRDIDMKYVENGLKNIDKFLGRSLEKGKISQEQKDQTLAPGSRGLTSWKIWRMWIL